MDTWKASLFFFFTASLCFHWLNLLTLKVTTLLYSSINNSVHPQRWMLWLKRNSAEIFAKWRKKNPIFLFPTAWSPVKANPEISRFWLRLHFYLHFKKLVDLKGTSGLGMHDLSSTFVSADLFHHMGICNLGCCGCLLANINRWS